MEFIKKYMYPLLTGIGILVALLFFSLNVPRNREANIIERSVLGITSPLLLPVSMASTFVEDIWDNYIQLVDTNRENLRLREDIRKLNQRVLEENEALLANQRLEKLLDIKKSVQAPTIAATIIGEDVTSWFRTLVINRGSSSGIREGMAVISADGVVGQTVKVSPSTSRVLLLTDHTSGIAATIQRSRARGVVKGKGEMLCTLEFTTREEDVKVGDMVITSGIGGVFLKGHIIGEVTMVKRGEYGIFQSVSIRPTVNISHLEEVLVVQRGGYE
ncbi:MAG: rod shape-determining protein MreC [Desulfuromonadaceae bacterium]|nr:rod shape-determining protein MreC [Desulfuromonadaceae bacterium]MDD4130476.1 rod shape-determining protein MreC [Desulfuromonadaceae bacterium]